MRKDKIHCRGEAKSPCGPALCGASSDYGLLFGSNTFGDSGPDLGITCKNCLKIIDRENAELRAGVK